jgi:hypothetical protein
MIRYRYWYWYQYVKFRTLNATFILKMSPEGSVADPDSGSSAFYPWDPDSG